MSKNKINLSEVLASFHDPKPRKKIYGNYRIEGDALVYQAQTSDKLKGPGADFKTWKRETGELIRERDARLVNENGSTVMLETLTENSSLDKLSLAFYETNLIARKFESKGQVYYFYSTAILDLIGRTVAYGNESRNRYETEIQRLCRARNYKPVPSEFLRAMNAETFEVLEESERRSVTYEETIRRRHYYSSDTTMCKVYFSDLLFKSEGQTYLVHADERDAQNSKLSISCEQVEGETIVDALASLVPEEIRGLPGVKSIGHLYFVPTSTPTEPKFTEIEKACAIAVNSYSSTYSLLNKFYRLSETEVNKIGKDVLKRIVHEETVDGFSISRLIEQDEAVYCTGKISKDGRATLSLLGWHRLVKRKVS